MSKLGRTILTAVVAIAVGVIIFLSANKHNKSEPAVPPTSLTVEQIRELPGPEGAIVEHTNYYVGMDGEEHPWTTVYDEKLPPVHAYRTVALGNSSSIEDGMIYTVVPYAIEIATGRKCELLYIIEPETLTWVAMTVHFEDNKDDYFYTFYDEHGNTIYDKRVQ